MEKLKTKGEQLDQIKIGSPKISAFSRTSNVYGTARIGDIVPTRVNYLLPHDNIKGSEQYTINFEPLAVPIMGNLYYKSEHFVVPLRVLWHNFKKFYTGKFPNAVVPSISLKGIADVWHTQLAELFSAPTPYNIGFIINNLRSSVDTFFRAQRLQNEDLFWNYYERLEKYKSLYANQLATIVNIATSSIPSISVDGDLFENIMTKYNNGEYLDSFVVIGQVINTNIVEKFEDGDGYDYDLLSSIFDLFELYYNCQLEVVEFLFGVGSLFDYMHTIKVDVTSLRNRFHELIEDVKSHLNEHYSNASSRGLLDVYYNTLNIFKQRNSYVNLFSLLEDGEDLIDISRSDLEYIYKIQFRTDAGVQKIIESTRSCSPYFVPDTSFSWLPFRANYMIWYYNYRDKLIEQDHIEPEDYVSDSPQTLEILEMSLIRPRSWSKDTYTTALTNTGSGNVYVPTEQRDFVRKFVDVVSPDGDDINGGNNITETIALNDVYYRLPSKFLSGVKSEDSETIESASLISVDNINRAKRLARFLQKELILSNDYKDILFSHWSTKLSDRTLERPMWIDGNSSLIRVEQLVNNTTTSESVAGDKAGIAYGSNSSDGYEFFVEEPMFELAYMSVMPSQVYPYGIDKAYLYSDRFDFPWNEFADLGMDAVYNIELQSTGVESPRISSSNVDFESVAFDVFGYQGRYYNHKCEWDEVHGHICDDMKDYVFGRSFDYSKNDSKPVLNYEFLHMHMPMSMFVVEDGNYHQFRYNIQHKQGAASALPLASTESY